MSRSNGDGDIHSTPLEDTRRPLEDLGDSQHNLLRDTPPADAPLPADRGGQHAQEAPPEQGGFKAALVEHWQRAVAIGVGALIGTGLAPVVEKSFFPPERSPTEHVRVLPGDPVSHTDVPIYTMQGKEEAQARVTVYKEPDGSYQAEAISPPEHPVQLSETGQPPNDPDHFYFEPDKVRPAETYLGKKDGLRHTTIEVPPNEAKGGTVLDFHLAADRGGDTLAYYRGGEASGPHPEIMVDAGTVRVPPTPDTHPQTPDQSPKTETTD